jgi:hypothetical protein
MNLVDVSNLFQDRDGCPHNWNFLGPVVDLFNCNGVGIATLDNVVIIFNWNPHPMLVKHTPIFLDKGCHLELNCRVKM